VESHKSSPYYLAAVILLLYVDFKSCYGWVTLVCIHSKKWQLS